MHFFSTKSSILNSLVFASLLAAISPSHAAQQSPKTQAKASTTKPAISANAKSQVETSAVETRSVQEQKVPSNSFTIGFYKPNYVMPYYYTGSPYNKIYAGQTPQNEKLTRDEIKYQFSLKVPIWKNILHYPSTMYLGYTQLSYWQSYNKSAFFRETDYQPELFVANEINYKIYHDISLNFVNVGAEHQSNGFGNSLERSWNRVYLEGVISSGNLMLSLKPWVIVHDSALREHNPNIGSYLGYMQVIMAYKYRSTVFDVRAYGLGVHGGRRTTTELSYSFPLTSYINGYIQVFSGYGQSLIEYDHRTNSAGIGLSFSNWI